MNYCDALFDIPHRILNKTVFTEIETGDKQSYYELQKNVIQWARFFIKSGVRPGDTITIHVYNSLPFIWAHMGAQYIGAVSCLLDPLAQATSLPYHLKQTNSRLLITHLADAALPADIAAFCTAIQVGEASKKASSSASEANVPEKHDWDCSKTSYIYYTSGTTSLPKGVPLNYKNHQNFFKIAELYWKPSDASSRHICFVPFSHGFGSIFLIPWAIRTHSSLYIMRSFHPMKVEEAIQAYQITHIYGVPAHYQQLLKLESAYDAIRKLEMAFCAASKLERATIEEWKRVTGNPLHEGYGLIETTGGIIWRVHQTPLESGHVGVCPSPDLIEAGIVDDNDTLVGPYTEGEIVVRGDSVTVGYLEMPDENRHIFRSGWFHTGDKGYMTPDNQLIMTGRIKDIINIAGIKVSPFEVESVLNEHPQVQTSVVVSSESKLYGEIVKAFVICKTQAQPSERELVKYCANHLINYQVPKCIVFVEDFPKNNMGKIDRKQLRRL